ncbi:UDP-glycosyltransferase 91A1 [Linum perenne]
MNTAKNTDAVLHIAMFPWLAFGHILPFLELAKVIARKGHTISFISTPRNIDRLPNLPPILSSLITFVKLPLSPVENLPPNAEATSDLEVNEFGYLKKAYDLLQQPLSHHLRSASPRPDFIVCDYAAFWLPSLARELGISSVFFSIFLASALSFTSPPIGDGEEYRKTVEDLMEKPRWIPFETTMRYRRFEAEALFKMVLVGGDGQEFPELYRFRRMLRECDLIAVRTCPELEAEWVKLLGQIYKKAVFPIGVLPREEEVGDESDDDTWTRTIERWLDEQERGSVVYVAFGSEAKPSSDELTEIAAGLELSGQPFFWVLRSPDAELPEGFEERMKGNGVVWRGWAPQVKILAHDSVGGLLTHSGWSSVVEALQFGRPLVLLTFYADQGLNATLLREKGVGYLVHRDEEDGRFRRESVAESIRAVLIGGEEVAAGRRSCRDRAAEMQPLFADGEKHDSYVQVLLDHLQTVKFGSS